MLESECPYYTICNKDKRQGIKRCTIPKTECLLFKPIDELIFNICECGDPYYAPVYWNENKQKCVCQTCYGVSDDREYYRKQREKMRILKDGD